VVDVVRLVVVVLEGVVVVVTLEEVVLVVLDVPDVLTK
jgi:hypothetical protein